MTVGTLIKELTRELSEEYGQGEARAMARLIFHHFKGWDATAIIVHEMDEASEYLVGKAVETLERLRQGEPIQYVLEEARFYGMDLKVTRDVLIPRPETAELVDLIVKRNQERDLRVLDVGTGSGAIAIALARNLPYSEVTAIDISGSALEVAKENAKNLHARIRFIEADIFDYQPPEDSFDILVSNPPYVAEKERTSMDRNVLDHEPEGALFVPDGTPLLFYDRIAEVGMSCLRTGGRIYFEINPLYAADLRNLLERKGYEEVEIIKDSYNRFRFAAAKTAFHNK